MIKLLTLAAMMVIPNGASATAECPASLVLNVSKISTSDVAAAQQYATCMSVPWLPTSDKLQAKLSECSKARASKARAKLKKALRWIDHIATQFPGCETRLQVKERNNA
jgi:hypothetical protein